MKLLDLIKEDDENLPDGGNCFDSSYDFMMRHGSSNIKLKLVHGYVSGQGPLLGYKFAHGWCEDDDTVFDNANNRTHRIPKVLYYAIGKINPKDCKYYTHNETIFQSLEYLHKGPWEIENNKFKEK